MKYVYCILVLSLFGCGKEYIQGPAGVQGIQGNTGPIGPAGKSCTVVTSNTGATVECSDGTSSAISNGLNGATGSTGSVGDTGSTGQAGTNGTNGQSCLTTVVSNGVQITCPESSPITILNGVNGTNATPISIVQFCQGVTTYPSVFAEVGICYQGNIYAVYSIPGSFLTYTPPGYYSSSGINSSCNFTILPNCGIQN